MKKGIKEVKKQREFNKNLGKNMTHGEYKNRLFEKEKREARNKKNTK